MGRTARGTGGGAKPTGRSGAGWSRPHWHESVRLDIRRLDKGAGRRHRQLQVRGVRICADLDAAFRDPSLTEQAARTSSWMPASYCTARVNLRAASEAVVIATGVAADGHREVLGFAVGGSEDGAFWTAFLPALKACGLTDTQLVISDAHARLKAAIAAVLLGAS